MSKSSIQTDGRYSRFDVETVLIRFLSVVLISNSHMYDYYPRKWMAADGLLGVSWFFMLAGLGLSLSSQAKPLGSPAHWYWRRIVRIYPSLWLVTIAIYLLYYGNWHDWTALDYVESFLWPTCYTTFVKQIMVFYIPLYLLLRVNRAWIYPVLIGVTCPLYVVVYMNAWRHGAAEFFANGRGELSNLFTFQIFLLGAWMGTWIRRIHARAWRDGLILLGTFAIYLALKYAIIVQARFQEAYFVLQVLTALMGCELLIFSQADVVKRVVHNTPGISRLLAFMAGLTLEIYLIQFTFAGSHTIATLPFPLNFVVFWLCVLGLAYATSALTKPVGNWLLSWKQHRPKPPRTESKPV